MAVGSPRPSVTAQGRGADAVIVVSVPDVGEDELVDQLGQTAILTFRPVLAAAPGTPTPTSTPDPTPTDSRTTATRRRTDQNQDNGAVCHGWPRVTSRATRTRTAPRAPRPHAETTPAPAPTAPVTPAPASPTDVDPALQQQFAELDCSDPKQRNIGQTFKKNEPAIACSEDGLEKYILGPVAVDGANIDGASAGIPSNGTSWVVQLDFDGDGTKAFAETTTELAANQGRRRSTGSPSSSTVW